MIYTITLSPALDYYMVVDKPLINEEVNRSSLETYKAGGKGLNVSRVLAMYGIKSKALALIGGFTGEFIRQSFSNNQFIDFVGIEVDGITRINSKIFASDQAICVNGNGPIATIKDKEKILVALNEVQSEDYVMVCGKMAKGLNDDFVKDIARVINNKKAKLIIDMESINKDLIETCQPYLIKPNLYELSIIMNEEVSLSNIQDKVQTLFSWGLKTILVSLGKDGAYYNDGNKEYKVNQPVIKAVNKVGCGDAMLGSFVGKLSEQNDLNSALAYACAAGCATASQIEDIELKDVEKIVDKMKITQFMK